MVVSKFTRLLLSIIEPKCFTLDACSDRSDAASVKLYSEVNICAPKSTIMPIMTWSYIRPQAEKGKSWCIGELGNFRRASSNSYK